MLWVLRIYMQTTFLVFPHLHKQYFVTRKREALDITLQFFLVLQVVELKNNKPRTWTGVEYSTSNCFPILFYISNSWKKSYLDYCKYYLMISHHISANRAWWKSCINLIYILSHVIFKTHLITAQADASQEKSSHCLCVIVFCVVYKGINSQIFF